MGVVVVVVYTESRRKAWWRRCLTHSNVSWTTSLIGTWWTRCHKSSTDHSTPPCMLCLCFFCISWPMWAPGHNATSIQFFILALYILFCLFISYVSPFILISSLFPFLILTWNRLNHLGWKIKLVTDWFWSGFRNLFHRWLLVSHFVSICHVAPSWMFGLDTLTSF